MKKILYVISIIFGCAAFVSAVTKDISPNENDTQIDVIRSIGQIESKKSAANLANAQLDDEQKTNTFLWKIEKAAEPTSYLFDAGVKGHNGDVILEHIAQAFSSVIEQLDNIPVNKLRRVLDYYWSNSGAIDFDRTERIVICQYAINSYHNNQHTSAVNIFHSLDTIKADAKIQFLSSEVSFWSEWIYRVGYKEAVNQQILLVLI